MTKTCGKCSRTLPTAEFYKHCRMKDGLSFWCKDCSKEAARRQRRRLKEKGVYESVTRAYRNKHRAKPGAKEKRRAEAQAYYAKNRAKILARNRAYEISARGTSKSKHKKRAARFVSWADQQKIDRIYKIAALATASSGIPHHVDHKIPLCGRKISGLHVEGNLQVLPFWENLEKHNKYEVNCG